MQKPMPAWFAAEDVFYAGSGWFIGSPKGLALGPYSDQEGAKAASREIQARLLRAKDKGEMIRIVRGFLDGARDATTPASDDVPSREGEKPKLWFRSDRFFAVDGSWFFSTREGIDVGPYPSKRNAERDAERLIRLLQELETRESRMVTIYEFMRRPVMREPLH